jgi:ABC-type branched-subunit amino acid transport system substrate-binding protein
VRGLRVSCVAVALVVVAGCSSSKDGKDEGTQGLFSGTSVPGGTADVTTDGSTDTTLTPATLPDGSPAPTTATGTAGAAATTRAGGGATGSTGTVPGAAGFATSGQSGRGYTASEVTIGFQDAINLEVGFALLGAKGTPGDDKQLTDIMVDWVNEHGGIAGRTLRAVHHGTEATSGTWATQAQEACATLTEDNQVVVAVSSFVGGSDAMSGCFASKGVPYVESNLWPFSAADYARLADILYQPGRMNADRWAKVYVDGLQAAGYFEKNAKLGLLRVDGATFDHVANDVFKPRLASLGLKLAKEVVMSNPNGVGDYGRLGAQVSNAIVQFRSEDVDHLMFLEPAGAVPFFFMPAAESQGYHPRYGLSSSDIPATQAAQSPGNQLERSVFVGWMPASDVGTQGYPEGNPIWNQCKQIMQEAGIPADTSSIYTIGRCDAVLFWKAVLERAKSWTRAGIRAAVDSLGTDYQSGYTFSTRLAAGQHDGATAYRLGAFDTGCACYKYTTGPRPA